MEKIKVYIAGKITGTNKKECLDKFQKASDMITIMGFEPINPMELNIPWETPSSKAVELCIPSLLKSDILFLLSDWRTSEGALEEYRLFDSLKKDSQFFILQEDEQGFSKLANYTRIIQK